jgi:UDP-N-acetylglucosamine 2-epimerase
MKVFRHAVTKFAHIHFPASDDAKERIVKLGERSEDVYLVGCSTYRSRC